MRLCSRIMSVLCVCVLVAGAYAHETPRALIEAVYAPYLADSIPDGESDWRSERLNALYEADAARTPEGEIGALGFDPYINGQDWTITELSIGEPVLEGDRGTVSVTFRNFDVEQTLVYSIVREADGWKVDDVESMAGEAQYVLSDILSGE